MTAEDKTAEKLLPQNLEAEAATLGSILIDAEGMREARAIVSAEDFYREAHRQIFSALETLYLRDEPTDILTVGDELSRLGKLDAVGGLATISGLTSLVPTSANLAHYAQIVARTALMRRLIHAAGQIASIAFNEPDGALAIAQAHKLLRDVELRARTTRDSIPFHLAVEHWLEGVHCAMEGGKPRGILSGFPMLDALTMGFQPSELWYIPGRPGSGKSAWAVAMAEHNAVRLLAGGNGETVEYITLEMQATQQVQRIIASRANLNGRILRSDFFDGDIFQEAWYDRALEAAREQQKRIKGALRFYDRPLNTARLESHLARAVDERACRLAVVDYLGLIEGDDPRADEYKRLTRLSFAMKQLAMKLNIPIVCLLQMNRYSEHRENRRPMLSDLRDSGGLEQDADGVIGIYRPAYYNRPRAEKEVAFAQFMELWIIKARSSIGNAFAPVRFEEDYTRVSDWPRGWDYPTDDTRPGNGK